MGVLFALLIAMQSVDRSGSTQPVTLSVCDVLSDDPTKLNGKAIRVRGYLAVGPHETLLGGDCKAHLVTKGLAWGNYLSVYRDASDEKIERAWERIGQKVKRLHGDFEQDKIWLTIVGRLETRASMEDEVVQMPHGLARAGFGQMGGSPAEINVISVEDVTVERQPGSKAH